MSQYALLNLLANGSATMKDLSVRMLITKPAVTNLVDRLEKHDFLKRKAEGTRATHKARPWRPMSRKHR